MKYIPKFQINGTTYYCKDYEAREGKVDLPRDSEREPVYGPEGSVLRSKGNGKTEWATVGQPTDSQTAAAVNAWLDAHPEAVTTVEDHSLSIDKMAIGALKYITPEMFGAVGDGETDDSDALNACFADANSGIVLLNGTYKVTKTITIPHAYTTVICNGIIYYALGADQYKNVLVLNDHCSWQGGRFIGPGPQTHYSRNAVIYAEDREDVIVRDTQIEDCPYIYCIEMNHCEKTLIDNNKILNYTYGAIVLFNGNIDSVISRNYVYNGNETRVSNRYPISVSLYSGFTSESRDAQNIKVIGNTIEDVVSLWEGIDGHGGINVVISDNIIKNVRTGIAIFGSGSENTYKCSNLTITNNQILLDQTNGVTRVANNTGIYVNDTKGVVISGNAINGAGHLATEALKYGAGIVLGIIQGLLITDNQLYNNKGSGIYISSTTNARISGNIFVCANSADEIPGLYFENTVSNKVEINDNKFIGFFSIARGPRETGGSTPATEIYLKDNYFDKSPAKYNYMDYLIPDKIPENVLANFICGKVGDIMWNDTPSSGHPVGWMCITAGTTSSNAVWKPMANLT